MPSTTFTPAHDAHASASSDNDSSMAKPYLARITPKRSSFLDTASACVHLVSVTSAKSSPLQISAHILGHSDMEAQIRGRHESGGVCRRRVEVFRFGWWCVARNSRRHAS